MFSHVAIDYGQDSFLVCQDLLLALLNPCLILKYGVELCLILDDLNLISQDSFLVREKHLLVLEYFFYSHQSNLH